MQSQLAGIRSVAPNPDDYIILPEIISKEPLAPVVRHGDDQWYDIVNWTSMPCSRLRNWYYLKECG